MKCRIDKGSVWSSERDDVVYVKLHLNVPFHYVAVGI